MPLVIHDLGVRDCFVPRPGYAFLDIDIEALELCTLAQVEIWLLKDDRKAKQINSGMDLHCVTGAVAAGMPYREFFRQSKGYDPETHEPCEDNKHAKNIRNLAKVPNFGKPGGMADRTLVGFARTSYGIKLGATPDNPRPSKEVSEAAAVRIGNFWRQANPNDQEYLDRMRYTRGQDGMYHVIIGHPSIGTTIRRGKATYCAACNSPFQGLGALAAGEITFELQRRAYTDRKSALFGSRLVVHAYDQWVCETPLDRLTDAGHELEELVPTIGARKVPDVKLKGEAVASASWSKSAKKVVEKTTGQLLVWGTEECSQYLAEQKGKKAA